jgi:hypothetical protein
MQRSWYEGVRVEPLSKYEARQFLRHTTRVRSLTIHGHYLMTSYHLHLLSGLPVDTCMFPRLLSLSWLVTHSDDRYLHLFLSPTLRHFHVLTIHCDLKSITGRCAGLENLSIVLPEDPMTTDDISLLSHTVRSCNRLVKLCCPLLDSSTWRYLSELPTLVTLTINGPDKDGDLLDWNNLNFVPFLNLTALSLSFGALPRVTATNIATAIQHSNFPSLKKFELQVFDDYLPWEQAEQIIGALSQCKAHQTLEHVTISLCELSPEALEYVDSPAPAVRQFFHLTQLRSLKLFVGFNYVDNDLLLECASSWPHIESLILESICGGEPTVTFRGLFAALRLCPHLHTLGVLMDAANIDINSKAESFQHSSLQKLHLGDSRVGNAEAVALIIFSMLPHVGEVMYFGYGTNPGYLGGNSAMWWEVNRHLRSFAAEQTRLRL